MTSPLVQKYEMKKPILAPESDAEIHEPVPPQETPKALKAPERKSPSPSERNSPRQK